MNSLLAGVGTCDRAAPTDDPVTDAATSEAIGCDLVSAVDHPVRTYPACETQTLLTRIATRTTRIGIVPRVLRVPFRRPALAEVAAAIRDETQPLARVGMIRPESGRYAGAPRSLGQWC